MVHPAAAVLPLVEGAEFEELVASIRENGLRHPIVMLNGQILDGRNRARACALAGVEPRKVEWSGEPGTEAAYVIDVNLRRRHLDASQRAMLAARIANLSEGRPTVTAQNCAVSQPQAAAMANVSRRSVQLAKAVLDSGDRELVDAVERGEMPVSKAAKIAKNREPEVTPEPSDATRPPKGARPGPKVRVPDGMTAEDLCRKGMQLHDQGKPIEEIAAILGVAASAFSQMRYIVLLSERDDLSEREASLASSALADMNTFCQPITPYRSVEHIVQRIWGGAKDRKGKGDAEKRRLGAFERAYGVIITTCASAAQIDVPHLSPDRAREAVRALGEAAANIRLLRAKIEEIHR